MDNLEKLATQKQDENKQSKKYANIRKHKVRQYMQTSTNNVNKI